MKNLSNTKKGFLYIIISVLLYLSTLIILSVLNTKGSGVIFVVFLRGILGIASFILFFVGLAKLSFNSNSSNQMANSIQEDSTKKDNTTVPTSNQKVINIFIFIFILVGIPILLRFILPENQDYYLGPWLVLVDQAPSSKVLFMNFLIFLVLPFSWFFLLVWWFKKKLK